MKKIKDYENYMIDPSSGGIVNINMKEYEAYKVKKQVLQNKAKEQNTLCNKIESLESDINILKSDLCDIKTLLSAIANKM